MFTSKKQVQLLLGCIAVACCKCCVDGASGLLVFIMYSNVEKYAFMYAWNVLEVWACECINILPYYTRWHNYDKVNTKQIFVTCRQNSSENNSKPTDPVGEALAAFTQRFEKISKDVVRLTVEITYVISIVHVDYGYVKYILCLALNEVMSCKHNTQEYSIFLHFWCLKSLFYNTIQTFMCETKDSLLYVWGCRYDEIFGEFLYSITARELSPLGITFVSICL